MEGDIICIEDLRSGNGDSHVENVGFAQNATSQSRPSTLEGMESGPSHLSLSSRQRSSVEEIQRRRQALARARRQNDGLNARYSTRPPTSQQNSANTTKSLIQPFRKERVLSSTSPSKVPPGSSMSSLSPHKSRLSAHSHSSQKLSSTFSNRERLSPATLSNRNRQSTATLSNREIQSTATLSNREIQSTATISNRNRQSSAELSNRKNPTSITHSYRGNPSSTTLSNREKQASSRSWKNFSNSDLKKTNLPESSHLVLHISEGMDIKKAIERKKQEAGHLQQTSKSARTDLCVVTLSDSNDEDDDIAVELPLSSQNQSTNNHNSGHRNHKRVHGESYTKSNRYQDRINKIDESNAIETNTLYSKVGFNDNNQEDIDLDDSLEVIETNENDDDFVASDDNEVILASNFSPTELEMIGKETKKDKTNNFVSTKPRKISYEGLSLEKTISNTTNDKEVLTSERDSPNPSSHTKLKHLNKQKDKSNELEIEDIEIVNKNVPKEDRISVIKSNDEKRSRDISHESNRSRDKSPASKKSRDKSPASKINKDISLVSKGSRDISPASKKNRDISPVNKRSRDISPVSNRSRDISPVCKRSRDISPAKNRSRDISPVSNRSRDVSPVSKESRDKSPVSKSLTKHNLLSPKKKSMIGKSKIIAQDKHSLSKLKDRTDGNKICQNSSSSKEELRERNTKESLNINENLQHEVKKSKNFETCQISPDGKRLNLTSRESSNSSNSSPVKDVNKSKDLQTSQSNGKVFVKETRKEKFDSSQGLDNKKSSDSKTPCTENDLDKEKETVINKSKTITISESNKLCSENKNDCKDLKTVKPKENICVSEKETFERKKNTSEVVESLRTGCRNNEMNKLDVSEEKEESSTKETEDISIEIFDSDVDKSSTSKDNSNTIKKGSKSDLNDKELPNVESSLDKKATEILIEEENTLDKNNEKKSNMDNSRVVDDKVDAVEKTGDDSSSVIISETGDRNSSPIFLEEVESTNIFSILEKVDSNGENEQDYTNDEPEKKGGEKKDDENKKEKDVELTNSFKRKNIDDDLPHKKKRLNDRCESPDAPSVMIIDSDPFLSKSRASNPPSSKFWGALSPPKMDDYDGASVIIIEDQPSTSKLLYPTIAQGNIQKKDSSKPTDSRLFSKPGKRITTTLIPVKRKNTDAGLKKDSEGEKESAGGRRITTTLIHSTRKDKVTASSKDPELIKTSKELVKDKSEQENKTEQDNIKEKTELEKERINAVDIDVEEEQIDKFDVKECLDMFLVACGSKLPGSEYISVRTKLYKYWNQIIASSQNSSELANFIQMRWAVIDSDPKSIYIQIRDVMKKLKDLRDDDCTGTNSSDAKESLGKKSGKKYVSGTDSPVPGPSGINKRKDAVTLAENQDGENKPREVSERHRQKLQKALRQCAKEIDKLENAEIDFDDEDNSVYILEAKYKKRYMEIYRRLAKYDAKPVDLQRQEDKYFKFEDSKFPEVNTKITKFVNRNKVFPDFIDIKELVKECVLKLAWSDNKIHAEAEKIFQAVGKKIIKRRRFDEYENASSYIKELTDPAGSDYQLGAKLQQQLQEGKAKMDQVFQEYVDKQYDGKGKKDAGSNNDEDGEDESEQEDEEEEEEESENEDDGENVKDDSVGTCSLLATSDDEPDTHNNKEKDILEIDLFDDDIQLID